MSNSRIDVWAPPSGTIWGAWYTSHGFILSAGTERTIGLDFDWLNEPVGSLVIELRYFNGSQMVTEERTIVPDVTGSGSTSITISSGSMDSASTVSFRVKSSSTGQIVTLDPGPVDEFWPGHPMPPDVPLIDPSPFLGLK